VHHSVRSVLTGLCAAVAVVTSGTTALAYSQTKYTDPIVAGHSYVYYVHEVDTDRQPWAGRTVTITVSKAPGADASVAPSDSAGHATGPSGQSASGVSGADGLVFFILATSATPGENDFVWKDDTYDGLVVVLGVAPSPSASPAGGGAAAGGGAHPRGGGGSGTTAGPQRSSGGAGSSSGAAAARARLPQTPMPPLAAGLLAVLLVWLLVPPVLARRLSLVLPASLPGGRPAPFEAG